MGTLAKRTIQSTFFLATIFVGLCSSARTKEFAAPPDRVFESAVKAADARGVLMAQYPDTKVVKFAIGGAECKLTIVPSPDGSRVSIERWRGSFLLGRDNQIFDAIADDLAGKPIKVKEHPKVPTPEPPTGPARVLISTKDVNAVKSALVSECSANGFAILSETDHQVSFFKDFPAGSVVGYLLFGNHSPRAYRIGIQFMIAQEGDAVNVTAAAQEVVQNGFGATAQYVISDNPRTKADILSLMERVKQKLEQAK